MPKKRLLDAVHLDRKHRAIITHLSVIFVLVYISRVCNVQLNGNENRKDYAAFIFLSFRKPETCLLKHV